MILSGDNKTSQTCFLCLEEKAQKEKWLIRWSFEKISSAQSSQLQLEASAYRIQTDVNCQITFAFPIKNCVVASLRRDKLVG